jgi:hypothetical protein
LKIEGQFGLTAEAQRAQRETSFHLPLRGRQMKNHQPMAENK